MSTISIFNFSVDYLCGCDEEGQIPGRNAEQMDNYFAEEAKCETHEEGMESYCFALDEELQFNKLGGVGFSRGLPHRPAAPRVRYVRFVMWYTSHKKDVQNAQIVGITIIEQNRG